MIKVVQFHKMHADGISYSTVKRKNNTENMRAVGEFRGLILATTGTVWFKVLVGFLFCY